MFMRDSGQSVIFLLTMSLTGFGIKIKLFFENGFGCIPSFPVLWKSLGNTDVISSLNTWKNSPMKPSEPGVFLLE